MRSVRAYCLNEGVAFIPIEVANRNPFFATQTFRAESVHPVDDAQRLPVDEDWGELSTRFGEGADMPFILTVQSG